MTAAVLLGLLVNGIGARPASASVASVSGSAFGYLLNVTIFGGPLNTQGPVPSVVLPAGGSTAPVSASAPTGSAAVPPAQFFSSGPLYVSTQGTPGPTGSVTWRGQAAVATS